MKTKLLTLASVLALTSSVFGQLPPPPDGGRLPPPPTGDLRPPAPELSDEVKALIAEYAKLPERKGR